MARFARQLKVSATRLAGAQWAILVIFLILGYGLWRLQVMRSGYYASLAEQNRVRQVPILAPRGKIVDREGRTIVDNYPSFSVLLVRDTGRDLSADATLISEGLHMDASVVRERVRRSASMPPYEPIFIKDDITPDELAFIESHRNELPELETIMVHRRLYPKNGFAAHLIGYVGEVSEQMLNQPQWEFYNSGDVVGITGVERQYNRWLAGTNGERRAIVNSHGREVGRLDETPAVPGHALKLTIDIDMQIAAEQALADKNGAVVAMDPRTGEILALVSRPTFDPNDFAVKISSNQWNALVTDPTKPLLNKAIQAQLAPGSVFKIIMAAAGTHEGIAQNLKVNCGGGGVFYGRYFKCWVQAEHRTHGVVDLSKGIFQSCDVFFYTLAERLGINKIADYAGQAGLGKKTGIDLPQEVSGTMPSEEWKLRLFHQKWYAGETISVGIGQGAVATTPIQLVRAIGGIANGGVLRRPHVVALDQFSDEFKPQSDQPEEVRIPLDQTDWERITDAMSEVVGPLGTANSAHLPGIDFAGKTGSAQTVSNDFKKRAGGGASLKDNGWFAGVTPRRNPEIAVAVLIEQGEHGYLAARIASQVIKAYVEKKKKREAQAGAAAAAGAVAPATPFAPAVTPGANTTRKGSGGPASGALAANAIEVTGIWGDPQAAEEVQPKPRGTGKKTTHGEDEHHLFGGRFKVPLSPSPSGAGALLFPVIPALTPQAPLH